MVTSWKYYIDVNIILPWLHGSKNEYIEGIPVYDGPDGVYRIEYSGHKV